MFVLRTKWAESEVSRRQLLTHRELTFRLFHYSNSTSGYRNLLLLECLNPKNSWKDGERDKLSNWLKETFYWLNA